MFISPVQPNFRPSLTPSERGICGLTLNLIAEARTFHVAIKFLRHFWAAGSPTSQEGGRHSRQSILEFSGRSAQKNGDIFGSYFWLDLLETAIHRASWLEARVGSNDQTGRRPGGGARSRRLVPSTT